MCNKLVTAVVATALFFIPLAAQAARVSPMIVEMQPRGGSSVARIELTNDADRDIAFEARLMRGEISEKGELALTPADEQFVVFPAQSIVQRKSQQVFRIQYVGDTELAKSEIYYLSIQQVPVVLQPGVSKVQVVVNYNVLVNVIPNGSKPVATVVSIDSILKEAALVSDAAAPAPAPVPAKTTDVAVAETAQQPNAVVPAAPPAPQPGLVVRLTNEGTRYYLAGLSRWEIAGTTKGGAPFNKSFRPEDMTKIIGVGVVAPDKTREFFVPTDEPLVTETVQIKVTP